MIILISLRAVNKVLLIYGPLDYNQGLNVRSNQMLEKCLHQSVHNLQFGFFIKMLLLPSPLLPPPSSFRPGPESQKGRPWDTSLREACELLEGHPLPV